MKALLTDHIVGLAQSTREIINYIMNIVNAHVQVGGACSIEIYDVEND